MTHALFGGAVAIDCDTQGPDTFIIDDGLSTFLYKKLGGGDIPVWKCDVELNPGEQTGKRMYLFKMAGTFLAAHGDAQMTCPQEVQTAADNDQLEVLFGSWFGDDVLNPGDHLWDVWSVRDRMWIQYEHFKLTTIIVDQEKHNKVPALSPGCDWRRLPCCRELAFAGDLRTLLPRVSHFPVMGGHLLSCCRKSTSPVTCTYCLLFWISSETAAVHRTVYHGNSI